MSSNTSDATSSLKRKRYSNRRFWFYVRRAIWILIAWVLISNLIFFYEFITLSSENVFGSDYDFKTAFIANLIVAVSAGILGGIITVNLMEYWLRRYAFWKALLLIVVVYTVAAVLISATGALYKSSQELDLPLFHHEVVEEMFFFFGTWMFVKNFFIWLFIVIITLIVLMVNDKYGPGVFPDYLMGKYFLPKNERRIFMFADIRNATGIAEKLGERKYFLLLKDFFKDIAPAIVRTRGEVYQYVGDEVVVSWKMKSGLKNGNALHCFYMMKDAIAARNEKYQKKYGLVPDFKVGYHYGSVTVGELGQIKREIAFSGDVLNTTARIQAQCNAQGVDILASAAFADIAYILPKGISRYDLGNQQLKGKSEEIALVTFRNDV